MQLGSASLSGPVNLGVGKSKSDFVFIRDAVIFMYLLSPWKHGF